MSLKASKFSAYKTPLLRSFPVLFRPKKTTTNHTPFYLCSLDINFIAKVRSNPSLHTLSLSCRTFIAFVMQWSVLTSTFQLCKFCHRSPSSLHKIWAYQKSCPHTYIDNSQRLSTVLYWSPNNTYRHLTLWWFIEQSSSQVETFYTKYVISNLA